MRVLKFIFIFLTAFYSCNGQKSKKHKTDPDAINLNDQAVSLINKLDNVDSCRKALALLDNATTIDSNCFTCYWNKINFSNSLKEYNRAIEAINNCLRIRPGAHDLYLIGGIFHELNNDSVKSKIHFEKSLVICNIVLDTMKADNNNYVMFTMNKAINSIMLGDSIKGNKILKDLYDSRPDENEFGNVEKETILSFMNKPKAQIITMLTDPEYSDDND